MQKTDQNSKGGVDRSGIWAWRMASQLRYSTRSTISSGSRTEASNSRKRTHSLMPCLVLLAKDDAGMFNAGRRKFYVIGVVGAKDIAEARCAGKMVVVAIAQEAEVTDCDSLDAAALQLSGDSYREVLIEIEASSHCQRAAPLAARTAGFGDESGRQFPVCVRSSRTGRHRSGAD